MLVAKATIVGVIAFVIALVSNAVSSIVGQELLAMALLVIGGQLVAMALPEGARKYLPSSALQAAVTTRRAADTVSPGVALAFLVGVRRRRVPDRCADDPPPQRVTLWK